MPQSPPPLEFRVLVAEDFGCIRSVIRHVLRDLGIEDIVEAASGSEAICALQADRFDLVLTDFHMPGANGHEVLAAVRELSADTPVILQTSVDERREVLKAIRLGVSDYLIKPYERDALAAKLRRWLPTPQFV